MMKIRGQKHWITMTCAVVLFSTFAAGQAQETETPPAVISPAPETAIATDIPAATETTTTPVPVETATIEIIPTETDMPVETVEVILTTPPEVTAEITVEAPEVTDEPVIEFTPEATAAPETTLSPEETAEATLEISPTEVPTLTASPTVTPLPLMTLMGLAHYQNRLPDDAGIQVTVRDSLGHTISQAVTTAAGVYSIQIPAEEPFWLRLAAPLHRQVEIMLPAGTLPPEIWLAGGDLNHDGCVNQADIDLITLVFMQSAPDADINNDGLINAVDIAILTGNYQAECLDEMNNPPSMQPSPAPSPSPTDEITLEATDVVIPPPEATLEAGSVNQG